VVKRRLKSDLVPAPILVARYFVSERDAIEAIDDRLATLKQQLDEMREENSTPPCTTTGLSATTPTTCPLPRPRM
jgi:hypothetical protein